MLDRNSVIQGDSINVLKSLPENSIDLIFADPPYWMRTSGVLKRTDGTDFSGVNDDWDNFNTLDEYKSFTQEWLIECRRVLKKDGAIWVICGMQCIFTVGSIMQDLGFWIINDVIWKKSNPTPNFKGTRLNNSHETLIWAAKSKKSKFTFNYHTAKQFNVNNADLFSLSNPKQLGSLWEFPVVTGRERLKDNDGKKLHSTQKPLALLHRIINISSKMGDIVLDPFGGTMTTAVAAKQSGRDYLMIERDQKYLFFGQIRIDSTQVSIGKIEKAVFDVKPTKVRFIELIEKKYLIPGEHVYFKQSVSHAVLLASGKLEINKKTYSIHEGASVLGNLKSERVNGFDHLTVVRDGKKVLLSEIRENYRTQLES
jgi:site-specific DNA-methyltransferase (adenine-specific)